MNITKRNREKKKLKQQLLIKVLMVQAGNDSTLLKKQINQIITKLKKSKLE